MAATSGAWLRKKVRHPWLGGPRRLIMYLAMLELRDFKPELEQFAVDARRAPKRIFDAHPPDQCAQLLVDLRSPSLGARPPTPGGATAGPCQRTSVSGRMIVRTCRIEGNQRYSWMKNQRSLFVSRTRPCGLRLKTFN